MVVLNNPEWRSMQVERKVRTAERQGDLGNQVSHMATYGAR